ncbi:MAG: heavy metal-binding domain-containing protein [Coriobacteriales bacterium]|jgi:uncharacterized protein YbjQ (UPF0145 family)|nr:heavy metal-binding domain-containing protein [Coriobacteriales bacterium]
MIFTSTSTLDGFKVVEYKGFISAQAQVAQAFKSTTMMQKFEEGKINAINQLWAIAANMGANAIIGSSIQTVNMESSASGFAGNKLEPLFFIVSGTAVVIAPIRG